jgi:hypothetical protein
MKIVKSITYVFSKNRNYITKKCPIKLLCIFINQSLVSLIIKHENKTRLESYLTNPNAQSILMHIIDIN